MRILFVTDSCPWPPQYGGQLRTAHLIDQLRRRVTTRVVVLEDPPASAVGVPTNTEFLPLGKDLPPPIPTDRWKRRQAMLANATHPRPELFRQFRTDRIVQVLRSVRSLAQEHDVCWVSWPYFAEAAMDAWPGARVVVDFVDVGALAQRSQLAHMPNNWHKLFTRIDTLKLGWHERRVARRAWRSVVCKAEDGDFLRQPGKVSVVPNGTDPRPALDPAAAEPDRVLFVGLMSFQPNVDAVTWFVKDALPNLADLPIRFDIVGRDSPTSICQLANGERVRVHGFVPDLTEMYRKAAVVVAPIRLGSGTKLKVLEALAYGKALVATGEAVRGVDLRPGVDFLQADTPSEMAAACRQLITNADLRMRLGLAGRKRVEALYTWDRIGELAYRAITP